MTNYRVLIGLNYTVGKEERRAEEGDIVSDLPKSAIGWLIECGAIVAMEDDA